MIARACIICAAVVLASAPAEAQRKPKPPTKAAVKPAPVQETRPWAEGVSAEAQQKALALYEQGNKRFVEKSYAEALKLYREAITSWNHPAIRFNMAECLISLDQPLEAYDHVVASLAFGEAALGPEHYERAVRTRQLLEGQLTNIEVSCSESGANVTLDGQPLFIGPGSAKRTLLPGTHQIVASKPGYQTLTREETLIPRKTLVAKLELTRLRTFEYRWARWKPWTVVGGGVTLTLLGFVFRYQAQSKYDEFSQRLGEACPLGCVREDVPADVRAIDDSAGTYNSLAKTSYVIGGVGIVAGAVLVLLNSERMVETPLPQAVRVDGRSAWFVWTF